MAKMTGTIIGMGVILIIMGYVAGTPGTAAGVIIFWVFYFGCMLLKGDFSNNSNKKTDPIPLKKDDGVNKCPICKMGPVSTIDGIKKCENCKQILD